MQRHPDPRHRTRQPPAASTARCPGPATSRPEALATAVTTSGSGVTASSVKPCEKPQMPGTNRNDGRSITQNAMPKTRLTTVPSAWGRFYSRVM